MYYIINPPPFFQQQQEIAIMIKSLYSMLFQWDWLNKKTIVTLL